MRTGYWVTGLTDLDLTGKWAMAQLTDNVVNLNLEFAILTGVLRKN